MCVYVISYLVETDRERERLLGTRLHNGGSRASQIGSQAHMNMCLLVCLQLSV